MARIRGQHAGLSLDRVVEAADRIAQARGLDAVTIRGVAEELGVAPNALYAWFPNKAALIDALIDEVFADLATGRAAPTSMALLLEIFDVMLEHGDLLPLFLSQRYSPGPNSTAVRAALENGLIGAGVNRVDAATIAQVLLVNVIGFSAFVLQTHGDAKLLDTPARLSARDLYARSIEWLIKGATSS